MTTVYTASAFSKNNHGGNKAGVVINEPGLDNWKKMELAGRLGYSETAFLTHSEEADFKLEYFTPTEEVPLCGHATIATFTTLNHLDMLDRPNYTIETKSGILNISIRNDGLIFMEQNPPAFYDVLDPSHLETCFDTQSLDRTFPVQIVSTGLRDILVPIDTPAHLQGLGPHFDAISALSRQENVVGIHAFALINKDHLTAVCRNFAPLYGIDEESATGTSNCALACYLFHYGLRQNQYIFEQGHNLNNISQIIVNIGSEGNTVTNVSAGGYGYLVSREVFDL